MDDEKAQTVQSPEEEMHGSGIFNNLTVPKIKQLLKTLLPDTQFKKKIRKADATLQLKTVLGQLSQANPVVAKQLRDLVATKSSDHVKADDPLKVVYDTLAVALKKPVQQGFLLSAADYDHAMARWKARPQNIPTVKVGSTYAQLKAYHDKYNWQVDQKQREAYTKAIEYLVQRHDVDISKKYKTIDVGIALTMQAKAVAEAQTDAAIQAEFVADLSQPPAIDAATMHKDRADPRAIHAVTALPKVRNKVHVPSDVGAQPRLGTIIPIKVGYKPFTVPPGTLFPPGVKLPPGTVGPAVVPLDGVLPPNTVIPPDTVLPPGIKWPGGVMPPGLITVPPIVQTQQPVVLAQPNVIPQPAVMVPPKVATGGQTIPPTPIPVPANKGPKPVLPIGTKIKGPGPTRRPPPTRGPGPAPPPPRTRITGPGPMPGPPRVRGPGPYPIVQTVTTNLPIPTPVPPLTIYGDGVLPPDGGGAGGGGRSRAGANGCPAGFFEGIVDLQRVKEDGPGPLFKYVYILDVLKDYDIDKLIYVRVARTMIEAVLVEGVKEFHVKTLAFFLNHVEGQLFVNMPTEADSKKLSFVTNIGRETDTNDVAKHLFKNIDVNSFPIHFLMMADFQVDESAIMPAIASENTARRVLRAYKRQDHEVREEY